MPAPSPDPLEVAKQRLARLLSGRDHSRAELQRKLLQRGLAPDLVQQALRWAEAQGFLDERRFAAAYTDELSRKGYGPRMIRKKLQDKGVRGEAPAEPAEPVNLREQAAELVLRRYGEPDGLEPADKLKAARFLLRRGFDHGTIRGVLGPLPRQQGGGFTRA